MAPYNPPTGRAHYTELDVSEYPVEVMLTMIGKGGKGFYDITDYLGLEYLWYNDERKVIELWGPWESLRDGAKSKLLKLVDCYNDIKK